MKPSEIIKRACNFLGGDLENENSCVINFADFKLTIEKATYKDGIYFSIFKRTKKEDNKFQQITVFAPSWRFGANIDNVQCSSFGKTRGCSFYGNYGKDYFINISREQFDKTKNMRIKIMHKGEDLGEYTIVDGFEEG